MVESTEFATLVGGGSVAVTLLVWMARKAWGQIVGTKTDTHAAEVDRAKLEADRAIFTNMQSELNRLSTEMKEIKAAHKAERQELEHRIDELEAKITRLSMRMGAIRKAAIDAYAELTSKDCKACPAIDRAVEHIKKILEEE